ncbi:MAG: hypothetical protein ACKPKO_46840, partial [Candidatus Fonsibacter sp.]
MDVSSTSEITVPASSAIVSQLSHVRTSASDSLLEEPSHGPGHRPHLPRPSRQSLENTLAVQDCVAHTIAIFGKEEERSNPS